MIRTIHLRRQANHIRFSHNDDATLLTKERVVLLNYDLYLPSDFVPTVVDGEVQEFLLCDMDQILTTMEMNYHDPIKPNCYVVIIDFLLRHGYISPDTPGYLDIVRELRSGDCQ
jgi:hypothetical protein